MAFVIVTKRVFLTCERIVSITLDELDPAPRQTGFQKAINLFKKAEPVSVMRGLVSICIVYVPVQTSAKSNGTYASGASEHAQVNVTLANKKEADALFAEIIKEVQEQHPSEAYLNTLVDKYFSSEDANVN